MAKPIQKTIFMTVSLALVYLIGVRCVKGVTLSVDNYT